jgi:hypothetical protein
MLITIGKVAMGLLTGVWPQGHYDPVVVIYCSAVVIGAACIVIAGATLK